jgi:hypothetical protein
MGKTRGLGREGRNVEAGRDAEVARAEQERTAGALEIGLDGAHRGSGTELVADRVKTELSKRSTALATPKESGWGRFLGALGIQPKAAAPATVPAELDSNRWSYAIEVGEWYGARLDEQPALVASGGRASPELLDARDKAKAGGIARLARLRQGFPDYGGRPELIPLAMKLEVVNDILYAVDSFAAQGVRGKLVRQRPMVTEDSALGRELDLLLTGVGRVVDYTPVWNDDIQKLAREKPTDETPVRYIWRPRRRGRSAEELAQPTLYYVLQELHELRRIADLEPALATKLADGTARLESLVDRAANPARNVLPPPTPVSPEIERSFKLELSIATKQGLDYPLLSALRTVLGPFAGATRLGPAFVADEHPTLGPVMRSAFRELVDDAARARSGKADSSQLLGLRRALKDLEAMGPPALQLGPGLQAARQQAIDAITTDLTPEVVARRAISEATGREPHEAARILDSAIWALGRLDESKPGTSRLVRAYIDAVTELASRGGELELRGGIERVWAVCAAGLRFGDAKGSLQKLAEAVTQRLEALAKEGSGETLRGIGGGDPGASQFGGAMAWVMSNATRAVQARYTAVTGGIDAKARADSEKAESARVERQRAAAVAERERASRDAAARGKRAAETRRRMEGATTGEAVDRLVYGGQIAAVLRDLPSGSGRVRTPLIIASGYAPFGDPLAGSHAKLVKQWLEGRGHRNVEWSITHSETGSHSEIAFAFDY